MLIPCAVDAAVVSAAALAVAAVDDVYCFCSTGVVVAAAVVSIVDISAMVVAIALGAQIVNAEDGIIGTSSCCCRLLLVSKSDCVSKNSVRQPEDKNRKFPRRKMFLFTRTR